MLRTIPLISLLLLTACGDFPLVLAQANCFDRANTLDQPTFTIRTASRDESGVTHDTEIVKNDDYAPGRDPAEFYDFCVRQIAGQPPAVPLTARPDWKG